jgi:hypothetical protein
LSIGGATSDVVPPVQERRRRLTGLLFIVALVARVKDQPNKIRHPSAEARQRGHHR